MSDHDDRINESIRKLEQHLTSPLASGDFDDLIFQLACDYAAENPGDYFLTLPGIILPIFT